MKKQKTRQRERNKVKTTMTMTPPLLLRNLMPHLSMIMKTETVASLRRELSD